MVKVRDPHPTHDPERFDMASWIAKHVEDDQNAQTMFLTIANDCVARLPDDGQEIFEKAIKMSDIVIHLGLDIETVAATFVYPFIQAKLVDLPYVKETFSVVIGRLIKGALKMETIRPFHQADVRPNQSNVDNLRKMLLAMIDDVRLIFIKLAEQVYLLRSVRDMDEPTRVLVAKETMDIYAPLANRLGIGQLKWELEDLAFHYTQPGVYKRIAKLLDERRVDRERYIKRVVEAIQQQLEEEQVTANVYGRPKHIFSIWRKMTRKNIPFDEVYDVRAVRIMVHSIRDCYAVLGVVHSLWQHIPTEFDDYIATPKENGYQSLHTAVLGPEAKVVEIQIRTYQMHEDAEKGVAAHWKYKESGVKTGRSVEDKIAWLRHLLEWQEELSSDANELYEALKNQVFEERCYVFTPKGDVIDLPSGSTPLDFAYHVHTEVGNTCRGAKINGRIVPLNTSLKTGDKVEILTSKQSTPSRDWLSPHLGYTQSSSTRSKIHHWFRGQDYEQNAQAGKQMLDKEWQRMSLPKISLEQLADKFNYKQVDDLMAAIGAGDVRVTQVLNAAQSLLGLDKKPEKEPPLVKQPLAQRQKNKHNKPDSITIQGVGNLMTSIASCCKPVPGDPIIGYITQTRGVMVHHQSCNELLFMEKEHPERFIDVEWGQSSVDEIYSVDIVIIAFDRTGLIRDISTLLANEKINVIGMNTHSNKSDNLATMQFTLEIGDIEQLGKVLARINQLHNVMSAYRKTDVTNTDG